MGVERGVNFTQGVSASVLIRYTIFCNNDSELRTSLLNFTNEVADLSSTDGIFPVLTVYQEAPAKFIE